MLPGAGGGGGAGGGSGGGASPTRLAPREGRAQAAEAEAEQLRDFLLAAEERAGALAEELEERDTEIAKLRAAAKVGAEVVM